MLSSEEQVHGSVEPVLKKVKIEHAEAVVDPEVTDNSINDANTATTNSTKSKRSLFLFHSY